jgi:16S rRNA (cytosine967-C5)-methyltransferase
MNGKPPNRPGKPAAGQKARAAALKLVRAVLDEHRALEADDPALGRLDPGDRARALRLARATLRGLGPADAALAPFLHRPPPARIHAVLRLGTVEICGLATPPHAAVDAAVSLARRGPGGDRHAGLVNAVLRRVAEAGPAIWGAAPPTRLPDWLRKALVAADGDATVAAIEAAHALGPPTDLTPRDATDADRLGAETGARILPGGSLRLSEPRQISTLPGYAEGRFWVQDAAAAIPARWLSPAPGARVLDLCAAPGGKTLQLAAAGAQVTALDASPARIGRLRANLARTGMAATIVLADARDWTPPQPFDAVLLDAPCSATGTIRRHPDLPHLRAARDLAALTALQDALIDRAVAALRPGGQLVYAVCSLLPQEGAARIAAALARHPSLVARMPDPAAHGLPDAAVAPGPGLRPRPDFWAGQGGMDGFYIALMTRAH